MGYADIALNTAGQIIPPVLGAITLIAIGFGLHYIGKELRKKKVNTRVYERLADGAVHFVGLDLIIGGVPDTKGRRFWKLKNRKIRVPEPKNESLIKIGKKWYTQIIKMGSEYVYMDQKIRFTKTQTIQETANGEPVVDKKGNPVYVTIETPIIEYTPMSYDMNIFRITEIEERNQKYAKKQNWWEQNKNLILQGASILLFIVAIYFSVKIVTTGMNIAGGRMDHAVNVFEGLANKLGGGGSPPGY